MGPNEECVFSATSQFEGEVICSFLQSNGLDAFISQESIGHSYGLTIGMLGETRVYVPSYQAALAKKLIDEMNRGDFIQPDSPSGDDEPQG